MTTRSSNLPGLCFAALVGMLLAFAGVAKEKDPRLQNLQGKVQMMNPDNSTITVEQKGGVRRQVCPRRDFAWELEIHLGT